jgi:carboxylate-amine ligase
MLAAIIRGLATTAMVREFPGNEPEPELLNAALWHAARDGISDNLVHPNTGQMLPAKQVTGDLIDLIGDTLDEHGDRDTVSGWLDRLFAEGTGADRQRAAFNSGGLPAVAALLHHTLAAESVPVAGNQAV